MANETIGLAPCINCGAQVPYRLDKQGRAYFRCTGTHDPARKACGMAVLYFGHADTEKLIAKFAESNNAAVQNRPDNEHEDEHERGRAEPSVAAKRKREAKPEAVRKPEPERKRGIFEDILGD